MKQLNPFHLLTDWIWKGKNTVNGLNGCNGWNLFRPLTDKQTEDHDVYSQKIPEGIWSGRSGVFVPANDLCQEISLRSVRL